jgi:hypothetical protein
MEGANSPPIYTIPWSKSTFEKLLAHSKDGGLPALAIKNLSNKRAYGVKSVQDFCVEDKDLAELVKSYEEPKPTFAFNIDPKKLTEFMKFQQAKEQTGEDHFQ